MPALLVHGNPDTAHLWDRVLAALGGDPEDRVAVDLPGFAAPRPDGFAATKESYVDWIVARLEELHGRRRTGRPRRPRLGLPARPAGGLGTAGPAALAGLRWCGRRP